MKCIANEWKTPVHRKQFVEGCKVEIKNARTLPVNIQPHTPHEINYENSLNNLYKPLIHYMMFSRIPTGECVAKSRMYFVNFLCIANVFGNYSKPLI